MNIKEILKLIEKSQDNNLKLLMYLEKNNTATKTQIMNYLKLNEKSTSRLCKQIHDNKNYCYFPGLGRQESIIFKLGQNHKQDQFIKIILNIQPMSCLSVLTIKEALKCNHDEMIRLYNSIPIQARYTFANGNLIRKF